MHQFQKEPIVRDRRTQARIQVHIPVTVLLPGMTEPITAINQDISWGGVLFVIPGPPPQETGVLRIVLPWKKGEQIKADAHLIRAKRQQDGSYLIAARFFSLTPRSHSRLEHLLKMLQSGEQAAHGDRSITLVRELEVTANDTDELRHMLGQIASGYYTVTVFDAYQVDQSIRLSIAGTQGVPGIRMRSRVVDVVKSKPKDFDWTELYTLTLEFEHPRRSIQAFVDLFLHNLPDTRRVAGSTLGDAPDWLRSTPIASPTLADRSRWSGKSGVPCILETVFPEALNRLTVGWGDVGGFEMLFRDLVLGDHGQPGGWPADAWEELEFLQNVHDLAYGISESRKSVLKVGRNV